MVFTIKAFMQQHLKTGLQPSNTEEMLTVNFVTNVSAKKNCTKYHFAED